MSEKLIYDSRFFSGVLHYVGKAFLWAGRWRLVGHLPDTPKFVAIAAPHSSNWDFPLFMAVVGAFRIRVRFLGKHSLFEGPFGWLFYWLGGIPVRRESAGARDLVDEAVTAFTNHEQMILGLAPEGTRSKVERWKSGYYRIAIAAGVPIQLAFVDSTTREIGLGPLFLPTGDMAADTATIQAFYEGKTGVRRKG